MLGQAVLAVRDLADEQGDLLREAGGKAAAAQGTEEGQVAAQGVARVRDQQDGWRDVAHALLEACQEQLGDAQGLGRIEWRDGGVHMLADD